MLSSAHAKPSILVVDDTPGNIDVLKEVVDRYAKFATDNLRIAASRIEKPSGDSNVLELAHFCHTRKDKRASA